MAENQSKATQTDAPAQAPVLRPGRAADPVTVATATDAQASAPAPEPAGAVEVAKPGQHSDAEAAPDAMAGADKGGDEASGSTERMVAESRQRKMRQMLRQCDRVLLMDFDLLAMNDWPDNYTLAEARRGRDLWVLSALVSAVIFLSGLTGFMPAWIAGGGFGVFVIILLLGIPAVRRIYTSKPSYLDLVVTRQRMLREARRHAAPGKAPAGGYGRVRGWPTLIRPSGIRGSVIF